MTKRDLTDESATITLVRQHLNSLPANCYLIARDVDGNLYPISSVSSMNQSLDVPFCYELQLGRRVPSEHYVEREAKYAEIVRQAHEVAVDTVMHPSPLGRLLRGLIGILRETGEEVEELKRQIAAKAVARDDEVKIDYQALLAKYMMHVLKQEGSTFAMRPSAFAYPDRADGQPVFSKDERAHLVGLSHKAHEYEDIPLYQIPYKWYKTE